MKRMEIAPGVHLSCDPAQKFNRCRVSIHFALPAKRATATAHALLPLVMERGYADCPDMTRMTKKLARLYGADLTVDARPMGANHNLCVSVTGIKDQFALEGEALTREYAARALGTAFHPAFADGVFDPEAVAIEKQMLKKGAGGRDQRKSGSTASGRPTGSSSGTAPPASGRRAIWKKWTP